MRTLKGALGFLAILLLLTPAPAYAWWGWLDDLSGPGSFRGPAFDVRLVCFGAESEAKRLVDELKNAQLLTQKVIVERDDPNQRVPVPRADVLAARNAWRQLIADLSSIHLTFPVLDAKRLNEAATRQAARLDARLADSVARTDVPRTVEFKPQEMSEFLSDSVKELEPLIAEVSRGIASINSTGVLLSACSTDRKRRSSIELGVNFWYADGNPGFANSQQIRLTTLMPMFSFRLFTDPRFDVLDAGMGAGVYWFTSKGFDSFSGVVLEPGRLDFHAPTLWATYPLNSPTHILRRIAAAPTFRFSLMEFPAGFSADAFAGVGEHHAQIPGELIKSWTIFINLDPFVRRAPFGKSTQ